MTNKSSFPWKSLNLGLSLAGMVAVPLVAAAFLGRWLDSHFNTQPWLFLGVTLFAFVITNIFVVIKSLKMMKQIEQEGEEDKNASSGNHN